MHIRRNGRRAKYSCQVNISLSAIQLGWLVKSLGWPFLLEIGKYFPVELVTQSGDAELFSNVNGYLFRQF